MDAKRRREKVLKRKERRKLNNEIMKESGKHLEQFKLSLKAPIKLNLKINKKDFDL